jgi:hypothetical protein
MTWEKNAAVRETLHASAHILTRLRAILKAQGTARANAVVPNTIFPTLDVFNFAGEPKVATNNKNLSGAGGLGITYFTVPDGKRWFVYLVHRQSTAAATRVFRNSITQQITVSSISELATYIGTVFGPAETIGLRETGNAADSDVYATIHYYEYDVGI